MKIKHFGRNTCSFESLPAKTTFEGFSKSQPHVLNRLADIANGKKRLSPTKKPADWPAEFYDIIKGDNGVTFEAGFDVEDQSDGTKALKVKILRVRDPDKR